MTDSPIILFDGLCNFCNAAVNFVLKRDQQGTIKFAALQSEIGQQLLQQHHLSITDLNSFVFIHHSQAHTKSTAALKVCRHLKGAWPLLYGLIIVPAFIRNGVYDFIAKNRYRWFGKKATCMVPTPEMKSKFLS